MDVRLLTQKIRREALRLGFSEMGVARAGDAPGAGRFRAWLRDGFHGGMRYLERQEGRRANPGLVLAGVRSILVAAMSYHSDGAPAAAQQPEGEGVRGVIGRYARGADYHAIVKGRLEGLLAFVRGEVPSARGVCHADTGPVAEKAWGAATSVGWTGKHTGLVSRRLGTRFFLGVILLDIPLDYDDKGKEFCGTCRRCLDACPTGALVQAYRLDARRCLSYLTIESRGEIPRGLRPLVGARIFGCDACQDACPWNRFAAATPVGALAPRAENLAPDLVPLARLSREGFARRFAGSPVLRATRDGFVRNVVVALGNVGASDEGARDEVVQALEAALGDYSPLVRAHAAWALGRVLRGRACAILTSVRDRESDEGVLAEVARALDGREEAGTG
ncbi:MAG: tRNA epoxyqueuosine(34) reductase QueG [Acidobacteriota bacterium]|jgi:epoxyqueuosine reductase|nr:tRNA epoxyqueuosine(34) reductase QueG [Acidobacteriota bacterium]